MEINYRFVFYFYVIHWFQRTPPVAPSNLMPPLEISDSINRLVIFFCSFILFNQKEIAIIYESSLISGEGTLSSSTLALSNSSTNQTNSKMDLSKDKEGPFKPILSAIVDPILTVCNLVASRLSAADMAVFMINCLSTLQVLFHSL